MPPSKNEGRSNIFHFLVGGLRLLSSVLEALSLPIRSVIEVVVAGEPLPV
jgi:hypothetical protein